MAKPEFKARDIYQEITDQIVTAIENGVAPWQRPWQDLAAQGAMRSAVTGDAYKGINVLLLNIEAQKQGYSDNRWCTYRQAQEKGWVVNRGSKATQIIRYQPLEIKDKHLMDENGDPLKHQVAMLKSFMVFNVSQLENGPAPESFIKPKSELEINELAERLIKQSGAIIQHGGNKAYYSPAMDYIKLPLISQFNDSNEFFGTALHELAHWTGHESRLNRDLTGGFVSESYAREELRAELSSAFLSADLGLPGSADNHAAYLQSWLKVLKEDKREIFRASSDASKIASYIKSLAEPQNELQATQTAQVILATAVNESTLEFAQEITPDIPEKEIKTNEEQLKLDVKTNLENTMLNSNPYELSSYKNTEEFNSFVSTTENFIQYKQHRIEDFREVQLDSDYKDLSASNKSNLKSQYQQSLTVNAYVGLITQVANESNTAVAQILGERNMTTEEMANTQTAAQTAPEAQQAPTLAQWSAMSTNDKLDRYDTVDGFTAISRFITDRSKQVKFGMAPEALELYKNRVNIINIDEPILVNFSKNDQAELEDIDIKQLCDYDSFQALQPGTNPTLQAIDSIMPEGTAYEVQFSIADQIRERDLAESYLLCTNEIMAEQNMLDANREHAGRMPLNSLDMQDHYLKRDAEKRQAEDKDNVKKGFSLASLMTLAPQINKMQDLRSWQQLNLVPNLDDNKLTITLSTMSEESIIRLRAAGYTPNVVINSKDKTKTFVFVVDKPENSDSISKEVLHNLVLNKISQVTGQHIIKTNLPFPNKSDQVVQLSKRPCSKMKELVEQEYKFAQDRVAGTAIESWDADKLKDLPEVQAYIAHANAILAPEMTRVFNTPDVFLSAGPDGEYTIKMPKDLDREIIRRMRLTGYSAEEAESGVYLAASQIRRDFNQSVLDSLEKNFDIDTSNFHMSDLTIKTEKVSTVVAKIYAEPINREDLPGLRPEIEALSKREKAVTGEPSPFANRAADMIAREHKEQQQEQQARQSRELEMQKRKSNRKAAEFESGPGM